MILFSLISLISLVSLVSLGSSGGASSGGLSKVNQGAITHNITYKISIPDITITREMKLLGTLKRQCNFEMFVI